MATTRSVRLPLERITACGVCGSEEHPSQCASCGEKVYCSKECQKKDWNEGGHKKTCGRFERLDLEFVYPFLSGIARFCHNMTSIYCEPHPAERHQIVNSPNPGSPPVSIPGLNGKAVLVKLGSPIQIMDASGPNWWRTADSPVVRRGLFRRITYSNYVLPMHFAVAFALLAEVYAEDQVRLRYRSSPIADFGIAKGTFKAIEGDRLAFQLPDGTFLKGQDPEDHYWIYLTTANGEDLILDFALYPFNFSVSAFTDPYFTTSPANVMGGCPAYFKNRAMRREQKNLHLPPEKQLHREKARFSVLRDTSLHGPVEEPSTMLDQTAVFFAFIEKVAGRSLTANEKKLVPIWLQHATFMVAVAMDEKEYKSWPKEAQLGIE